MATVKPTKPSITLPTAFGTDAGSVKTPYTAQELIDGYQDGIPQILDGGNLNYIIDALFQFLTYSNTFADWYNSLPAGTAPFINSSNQLDSATPVFGDQNNTFTGDNTFSQTITGSISGNAGTVTNGVYTTGNQTIAGNKTFSGTTKVPTPSSATANDTQAATTAWVHNWESTGMKPATSRQAQVSSKSSGSSYTAGVTGIVRVRITGQNLSRNDYLDVYNSSTGERFITHVGEYADAYDESAITIRIWKGNTYKIWYTNSRTLNIYEIPYGGF